MNFLSSSRIHFEFTIYFANLLRILYFFRFTLNSLSISRKYKIWILEIILSRNICILNIFRLIHPIWPLFDGFNPSLTSDDPFWPWKILKLNSPENFESKHMYIVYNPAHPPDLTLTKGFWPRFDLWWPLTGHNL